MMHKRLNTASQQAAAAAAAAAALAPGKLVPVPAAPAPARAARPANSRQAAAAAPTGANIRSRLLDKSVLSGRRVSNAGGGAGKLRTVNRSSGGNDDELSGRRGKGGGEQGDDEFDYEEDFQDDEEGIAKIDDMADEEETKELEVRRAEL